MIVEGVRLDAAFCGPPMRGGRALVFLHEGLGSRELWRDFPERCARALGLAALVYSRRGYGRSEPIPLPRPLDYLRREANESLPALLAHAGIHDPILFGHSDGATIALHYVASGRPLTALVAETPHVLLEPICTASIRAARVLFRSGELRERLAPYHDDVDGAFYGWADAWLDPGFGAAIDLSADLPKVTCPALLIQEERDPYGTLAQLDRIAALSGGPVEKLVLPGASHSPHRDHPAAILSALRAFLHHE